MLYGNASCANRTAAVISFENERGKLMGEMQTEKTQSADKSLPGTNAPGKLVQNLFIPFFMTVLS
jgi:hypothetical protein